MGQWARQANNRHSSKNKQSKPMFVFLSFCSASFLRVVAWVGPRLCGQSCRWWGLGTRRPWNKVTFAKTREGTSIAHNA